MTAREKIQRDTEMKEIIKLPKAREILDRRNFKCLQCGGFGSEKLIHAARCHGVDVEELIREIIGCTPGRE